MNEFESAARRVEAELPGVAKMLRKLAAQADEGVPTEEIYRGVDYWTLWRVTHWKGGVGAPVVISLRATLSGSDPRH